MNTMRCALIPLIGDSAGHHDAVAKPGLIP